MKLINPSIELDINNKVPLRLDLGSGGEGKDGYYSVDHLPLEGVDIVADLNKPLSKIPDNSVSHIYSRHALEHIHEFLPLMKELYRIAASDCVIEIVVPHFSNPYYYSDPTHVRFFGLYTMNYFVSSEKQPSIRKVHSFYSDVRFEIESIKIAFYRLTLWDRIWVPIIRKITNLSFSWQNFYERRLCSFFHASEIAYRLRVYK